LRLRLRAGASKADRQPWHNLAQLTEASVSLSLGEKIDRIAQFVGAEDPVSKDLLHAYVGLLTEKEVCDAVILTIEEDNDSWLLAAPILGRLYRFIEERSNAECLSELAQRLL
jgi:hypothetical protein